MADVAVAAFSDLLASEFSLLRQRLATQYNMHILTVHEENSNLKQQLDKYSVAQAGQNGEGSWPSAPSSSRHEHVRIYGEGVIGSVDIDQVVKMASSEDDKARASADQALMLTNGEGSQPLARYTTATTYSVERIERNTERRPQSVGTIATTYSVAPIKSIGQSVKRDMNFHRLESRQHQNGHYGDNRIAELSRAIVEWQLHSVSVESLEFGLHDGASWKDMFDTFVKRLVRWKGFDHVMGLVILINSITIGIEISADGEGSSNVAAIATRLEHMFLAVYIIEICLRFRVDGRRCLSDNWVRFDVLIASIGILSLWCLPAVLSFVSAGGTNQAVTLLETVIVMRVLRLLRLVRAFRMIKQFRISWRLVDGLLSSSWAMMSALALLVICLYVFACAGIELLHLGKTDRIEEHIARFFPTLPMTMVTLFRFVTLDSPSDVYLPIVVEQPFMLLYFACIVLVVSIALMNLVTAVLVEASIAGASKDKELQNVLRKQKVTALAPVLRKAFHTLDSDNSGGISREEVCESAHLLPDALKSVLEHYSITEIFDIIDMDGTGTLEENEFVEGLIQMATSDLDPDMMQIFSLIRLQRRDMAALDFLVAEMAVNLRALCNQVGGSWNCPFRFREDRKKNGCDSEPHESVALCSI